MPAGVLPSKIGVIIFPGFQLLDWAGPLDAFDILSNSHTMHLCTIASTLDPIRTQNHIQSKQGSHFSQTLVPTHTFAAAPDDLNVLLIPGGLGARGPGSEVYMEKQVEYLKSLDLTGNGSIKVKFWLYKIHTQRTLTRHFYLCSGFSRCALGVRFWLGRGCWTGGGLQRYDFFVLRNPCETLY
jgi:hypothetical protein